MKFLVLFEIFFVIYQVRARPGFSEPLSDDMPDYLLETIHQSITCVNEVKLNISASSINSVQASFAQLPEDNENFNRYFGCIFKKKGIVDDDGKINKENLRSYLVDIFTMGGKLEDGQNVIINRIMDKCSDLAADNYGQKSVKIQNCAINNIKGTASNRN